MIYLTHDRQMSTRKLLNGRRMKRPEHLHHISPHTVKLIFISKLQIRRISSATLIVLLLGAAICSNQALVCAGEKQAPVIQELAVPEPATVSLLALGGYSLLRARRRIR